jgi:hypothetical protein
VELVPLIFSSGWASGVNAYLTVLLLGLVGRFTDLDAFPIPDALTRTDVLIAAAVMTTIEFGADKIPYVDSGWDTVSTLTRPTIGAVIALLVAGDASSLDQALLVALGGTTALLAHLVKAGLRLAVNSSPEPFTNIGVSLAEDSAVATVVTLAVLHPWWAFGVSATLLVAGIVLVLLLLRLVRRGWQRRRERSSRPT